MAIGTPVHAATAAATTGTSTATASFTPTAGDRLFAFLYCRNGSAYVDPTISDSAGLTWTQVGGDFDGAAANPFIRARLYWADVGGSPSSMTVTCTVGTSTQHGLTVIQVPMGANPDTANVSSGINAAGDPSATITGTPAAVLSFAVAQNSNVYTQPTGHTEIVDVAPASAAFRIGVSYDLTTPSTTAAWTSGNLSSLSILLELKESAGSAYTLTADGGSFALTGTAASLNASRLLTAASGSFALTGTAANLTAARVLAAAGGSFTLTGTAAVLTASRVLVADSATFTLTGGDATLIYTPMTATYTLAAGSGEFTLTGTPATLQVITYSFRFGAATGRAFPSSTPDRTATGQRAPTAARPSRASSAKGRR